MVFKLRTFVVSNDLPGESSDVRPRLLEWFSLRELQLATNNFSSKNIIGRGGFGHVYKGILADGSVVAIKRLGNDISGGDLQFQTEVKFGNLPVHRNLNPLLGFCDTKKERLLVYPFMVSGNVSSYLREPGNRPLDLSIRRRIALGVARGLAHLHDQCEFKVIHRDVKASNVLLDKNFEAVLTDFGLARFLSRSGGTQRGSQAPVPGRERPTKRSISGQLERGEPAKYVRKQGLSCWKWSKTEAGFDQTSCLQTEQLMPIPAGGGPTRSQGVSCLYWSRTNFNYSSDSLPTKYTLSGHGVSCWQWSRMEAKLDYNTCCSHEEMVAVEHIARGMQSTVDSITHYYENPDTQITTLVCGTKGHLAPEYILTGRCSVKTDVYAYGIMLLELITGQRALDLAWIARDERSTLIDWVSKTLKEKRLEKLVDTNMKGCNAEEVEQMLHLALLCIQNSPKLRPKMAEVVTMLLEGDGLAERWEKWLLDEGMNSRPFTTLSPNPRCRHEDEADYVSRLPSEVLSGPR